jgi:outer membrane lipoprotein SlyB
MKKLHFLIQLTAIVLVYSSSYASGGGHGEGHRKHHHRQHQEARYYPQPETRYYPQAPQDPRSHQGLAGGVVGSVLGYEIGHGDPIATGLGAAAGSYLGNGMAGRR